MTNFENQCCTPEQAIALHKAGIEQDSLFYWSDALNLGKSLEFVRRYLRDIYNDSNGNFSILHFPVQFGQTYSAFNVAELGAMLLKHTEGCHFHNLSGEWTHDQAKIQPWTNGVQHNLFKTQAQCYADRLLCLLAKNPVKYSPVLMGTRLKKFYELKREA